MSHSAVHRANAFSPFIWPTVSDFADEVLPFLQDPSGSADDSIMSEIRSGDEEDYSPLDTPASLMGNSMAGGGGAIAYAALASPDVFPTQVYDHPAINATRYAWDKKLVDEAASAHVLGTSYGAGLGTVRSRNAAPFFNQQGLYPHPYDTAPMANASSPGLPLWPPVPHAWTTTIEQPAQKMSSGRSSVPGVRPLPSTSVYDSHGLGPHDSDAFGFQAQPERALSPTSLTADTPYAHSNASTPTPHSSAPRKQYEKNDRRNIAKQDMLEKTKHYEEEMKKMKAAHKTTLNTLRVSIDREKRLRHDPVSGLPRCKVFREKLRKGSAEQRKQTVDDLARYLRGALSRYYAESNGARTV